MLQFRDKNPFNCRSWFLVIYLLMLLLLFTPVFVPFAHAYIDPNAGGFFYQFITPILISMLGAIVVFWKRVTGFFKSLIARLTKKKN
jgi:hypothetical protein